MSTAQLIEQKRHKYLKMLGVDSWLSRTALPGAAESEDWVRKFIYEDVLADQKSTIQNTGSDQKSQTNSKSTEIDKNKKNFHAAQARTLAQSFDSIKSNSVPAPIHTANDDAISQDSIQSREANGNGSAITPIYTPPSKRADKAAPVMRLMFWLYEEVLVVDSLPAHSRGALSPAKYEQLLTNLIKAMGCNAQRIVIDQHGEKTLAQGSQPYTLNWPTLAGLSIDQGWEQAVSAVQHKLAKTLQFYSPSKVLMLGEYSGQMLMNLEDDFDSLRAVPFSIRKNITAITTHSLTEMLNVPGCKRDVWMDLQKILDK